MIEEKEFRELFANVATMKERQETHGKEIDKISKTLDPGNPNSIICKIDCRVKSLEKDRNKAVGALILVPTIWVILFEWIKTKLGIK